MDAPGTGLDFVHYRELLADSHARLKAVDSRFSQRFINLKMGARSTGWFADVLAGRQRLKTRHISPLSAVLRLEPRERELLRILVDLETADSAETRGAAHARWLEFRGVAREDVDRDRFRYFERWHYPALRELLLLKPFDGDYAALGAGLEPPISARQAKQGVQTLSRLGLLNPSAPAPVLVKKPGKTPHWRKAMEAALDRARPALELAREERDFSTLFLSLSPEGLRVASDELALLRQRLLALSSRDAQRNRVFQCLFQVFPVSKPVEDSDA